jgi:hypothetical protein
MDASDDLDVATDVATTRQPELPCNRILVHPTRSGRPRSDRGLRGCRVPGVHRNSRARAPNLSDARSGREKKRGEPLRSDPLGDRKPVSSRHTRWSRSIRCAVCAEAWPVRHLDLVRHARATPARRRT